MKHRNGFWHIGWTIFLFAASTAFALDIEIEGLITDEFPQITLRVEADVAALPMSAFSVTENGGPVTLDPECFNALTRPIDITFVIDRSRSMENNIDSVANGIAGWIDLLPENLDFRFGLVLYGQDGPPAFPCDVGYHGGPQNETTDSLRGPESLVARLEAIADNVLQGGQEPAYHAIRCAIEETAWRPNSERFLVVVSDENNDACQWASAIPQIAAQELIDAMNAIEVEFFAWINYNVACDCYDDCDRETPPNPPCFELNDSTCSNSGFDDFSPLAVGTGGETRTLDSSFVGLLGILELELLSTYVLCYESGCCLEGVPINVEVTAMSDGEQDSDAATYTIEDCPTGSGNAPDVTCWADNPNEFEDGVAFEMCAVVSDVDGDVTSVNMHVSSSACDTDIEATVAEGNRWCAVVPAACTEGAESITVEFRAEDACGLADSVVCLITVTEPDCYDLGDLPNPPYPTEPATGFGPAHLLSGIAWLGSAVDCEGETGQDSLEDNGMEIDCETQAWTECNQITIPITVTTGPNYEGQTLYLSGWLDHNGDGDFVDSFSCDGATWHSEWFIQDVIVTPGVNNIQAWVSNTTVDGEVNVRLRLGADPFCAHGYDDLEACVEQRTVGAPHEEGEVEDFTFYCPITQECCELCVIMPAITLEGRGMESDYGPLNVVMTYHNGVLRLHWDAVEGAGYYRILSGGANDPAEDMEVEATVLGGEVEWSRPVAIDALPDGYLRLFAVQPMEVVPRPERTHEDRGRWEMDEGAGDYTEDETGNGFHAYRWMNCPPTWDSGIDSCGDLRGFMHFNGFTGHPGCGEHLRVENDDKWYEDGFQLWTCIRIFNEPTIQTGAYYIISNNNFSSAYGGFALRIDPGWIMVNGERQYHNRLTGMVWNDDLNGGEGGWMTLQAPPPSLANPDRYSIPLGEWVRVCWVVDGDNSMLIINGMVVALGTQYFNSDNNEAPLIIGAGWRHFTYPIEYPFRGDIDCIRITNLHD